MTPSVSYNVLNLKAAEKRADEAAKAFYANDSPENFRIMREAEEVYRQMLRAVQSDDFQQNGKTVCAEVES